MNARELILLSPYQFPGQHSSMIGSDEVGDFLNGYSALWHPAALRGAAKPPRIASPYDYEQPGTGHLYAVPENPSLYQPEDWDFRVRDAGAAAFRSVADRDTTLVNLFEALQSLRAGDADSDPDAAALVDLPPDKVRPFFGIGLGFAIVSTLFEAMEHENVLPVDDFWQEVQAAVQALSDPDPEAFRRPLQAAAERLLTTRQVLYPVDIHLLDLFLLEPARMSNAWPAAFERGSPFNLIASASLLEELSRQQPERLAALRERVATEQVEVCGGSYLEREDPLLPVESQLWNLLKGLAATRDLLGSELRIFARQRFGFHPQLPLLLTNVGLQRALLLVFDDGGLPAFQATVVNWPSPDGRQIEGFTRTPYAAQDPTTFFHLAHYLHKTIMQDHAATLPLLHREGPAAPGYEDWLELTRLSPVLGQWTTLTRYLNEVIAGEQAQAASPDEFHVDYLSQRTDRGISKPVSAFAQHARRRRHLDTTWTLAALHRGLAGARDPHRPDARLMKLEDQVEQRMAAPLFPGPDATSPNAEESLERELQEIQTEVAQALAERLLARAQDNTPGYLLLNPCSFARRVALELEGAGEPLPIAGPVRACQVSDKQMGLVVEVPALGFAWIPRSGPAGTPPMASRMRLADARHVRNEFFEAEIDPATGGLRGLWDHRSRVNRIGQQLVFNPGSTMRATEVKVTSTGPALGEVVSEGALMGDQNQVLATYRQRYRAWLGRPILELRIEIYPELGAAGYPWHSYYGARFAWRDERALLLRGVNGTGYITSHHRPQTPDYLELRLARQNTVLFPGGLPFEQRHGARMLDVILMPPGETENTFDLALGLDRENPMQTAWGIISPVVVLPVAKGPPHVGDKGWLFHLDSPNLLLTSFRPAADGADAITARMLECGLHGGPAELRCVRNPHRAVLLDARGELLRDADTHEDAATFEVSSNDWVQLRVEFS
jgi:hypothetical protein